MLWRPATVIGVVVAFLVWWFGGFIPLTILVILYAYIANRCFSSFIMAGPRTSRQVPHTTVAYCQQLSALKLSKAYQSGELLCEDVVRAYIDHINHVNPYINAMVFECFDEAIQSAIQADKQWAAWRADRTKQMPSWLLGVPCTVKECMQVVGCPNSSGHPQRRHIISPDDSPVVRNFRNAGAIILGVTNTSELCMWYESSNYVYGISCNPYDTRCLVGGSSGGEGAAAGAVFSTFSIGSDIGGSIRMPAFFNGVFGHKASPHCISNRGQHPAPVTSANHYMGTGPISRFAEDLLPLCQVAAAGGFLEDPTHYPPGPLLKSERLIGREKPLRVYAVEDFGILGVKVSDAEKGAVIAAAQCLEKTYGAQVSYINLRSRKRSCSKEVFNIFKPFSNAFSIWAKTLTADKTEKKFTAHMVDSDPSFSPLCALFQWFLGRAEHTLPAIVLCLIEYMETHFPQWLTMGPFCTSAIEFKRTLEELLGDDGIIIAPTFPRPAMWHHYPLSSPFEFQYTAIFNALRMPVTASPIWTEDLKMKCNVPTPEEAREQGLPADHHLPKGVQIISRERNDELSLGVAVSLERVLGGYKYPGWAVLERPPRKQKA